MQPTKLLALTFLIACRAPAPSPSPTAGPTAVEVRAATAADLGTYTAGLAGGGPLIAVLSTSMGDLTCTLAEAEAPATVANFVGLARGMHPFRDMRTGRVERRPYFDGQAIWRVVPDFVLQSGDPVPEKSFAEIGTTEGGGPGYVYPRERTPTLSFDRGGVLAMIVSDTGNVGSQFLITVDPIPSGIRAGIFGRCAEVETARRISKVETTLDADGNLGRPKVDVTLNRVTISRGGP